MNVIEALESIEAAAQGNARLNALKEADSPELRDILNLALSPEITFGIKKLPEPAGGTIFDGPEGYGWWHTGLRTLLADLEARRLSGNAAQEAVAAFLGRCTETQRKWSERILRQDLRVNVGAKDVNKALGPVIFQFEVPLATDFNKVKEKDLAGSWIVQPKLDGGRCVAVLPGPGKRVKLLSRTGKEWLNFESVRRVLQEANENLSPSQPLYVDGEVVSIVDGKIDFQSIQKTMLRKDGVEVGKLQFVVFDAAYENEWRNPSEPYQTRLETAEDFVKFVADPFRVKMVQHQPARINVTMDLLRSECEQYVEEGYEGAMARRSDLPIENKRSKTLLKIKTFEDDEAKVIGAVEGTGKYLGMLGALVCQHKNGKTFEIGSGFNDAQRARFWNRRRDLVDMTVSFKFFELTDDGIPRFPIFRYFRSEQDL